MLINGPRKKARCLTMKSKFETVFWKYPEMFPKYHEDKKIAFEMNFSACNIKNLELCEEHLSFFLTLPLSNKYKFLGYHF
jgi:hypothetical protein